MNALVSMLIGLGWKGGALIVCFLLGLVAGALAWRKVFPRWPHEYDEVAKAIGGLEMELRKMDEAVDTLWVSAKFREERLPSARAITSLGSDPNSARINKLIVEVIIVKKRLGSLLKDLEKVSPWLTASPIRQTQHSTATSVQGVVIERKREGQSTVLDIDERPSMPLSPPSSAMDEPAQNFSTPISAETTTGRIHRPSQMVELYNRALTDPLASRQFREQYQPLRIGIVNAVERRLSPTAAIDPEFRETTDGDFFAFPMSEPNKYGVVPRLGLTIGPVSYDAGALGEIFGNPAYDPAQSYSRYRVREPAIFKRDGDNWELVHSGQLELGPPD